MVNMQTQASSVSSAAITTHQSATLSYGTSQQALFSSSASHRCLPLLTPNTNARYLGSSNLTCAATGRKLVSDSSAGLGKLSLSTPGRGTPAVGGGSVGSKSTNSSCVSGGKIENSARIITGDLSLSAGVGSEVLSDLSGAMEDWRLLGGSSLVGSLGSSGASDGGAGASGLQDIIEASVR